MLIKITNGAVSFGADTVLENVNIEINGGEKIAIVGRNGAGKTTLLKCITGEIVPEQGYGDEPFSVVRAGDPVIGYLKQISFSDERATLKEEVLKAFKPILDIEKELNELLEKMKTLSDEKTVARYSYLQERFDILGGYTYKKEYAAMVGKFGFTQADEEKRIEEFSGGQRTKIAFIKLLLSHPDVLLLDEPTNHLDISAIRWLESYIRTYRSAVVMVSHDRMFIEKTVDKVYEIEHGETRLYKGNYSDFERQKRMNYERQLKDYEYRKAEIDRLTRLVERFRYKATKASMAQSKLKQIERLRAMDRPEGYDLKTFRASFQPKTESVEEAFSTKELVVGYDRPLATIDLELKRGQKLGVIGDNGTGKSTFLKTIIGEIAKLSGHFSFGLRTEIGYFSQQIAQYESEESVLDDFRDNFPTLTDTEIRTALGSFLFSGDEVFKKVSDLSGGERVRLALCKLFKRRPNFLILDEPTNHMDLIGKETLENMLKEYGGTVIVVSHDRYLINKVADRLLVFAEGGAKFYPFPYAEYEGSVTCQTEEAKPVENKKAALSVGKREFSTPLKDKARRERRIKKLEEDIVATEKLVAELNEKLSEPSVYSDYVKIAEIQSRIDENNSLLETLTAEWMELSDGE